MTEDRRIFLIGYRATGKSTVARLLAARLGWNWLDTDTVLEEQAGRTIRQLFAEEGEAGFRARESALLQELSRRERHIIATGGGVILEERNRECLRTSGWTVWLTADIDTICARLQSDSATADHRPALTVGGRAEVEELLGIRHPLYAGVANLIVDTMDKSPEEVVREILDFLG